MCGICGVASADGAPIEREALMRMNEALVHRGPDSDGVYVDAGVGLAMRRLAIIDLEGGDQPIASEDGSIVVIQNGEIYNYRELRRQLSGRHRFRSASDTEVLVHLYEEQGPAFLERLRGMFAIALWDGRARRLLLARDRFGIKPLLYRVGGGVLSFASELSALRAQPDFVSQIDRDALNAYLTLGWIPGPLTIFDGVRKLPPGHYLLFADGRTEMVCFARPRPVPKDSMRVEDEGVLAEELRSLLRDSVEAHLVADVPVGVFLSGGVDSSLVAALAAEVSHHPLRTFSIGFEHKSFNELEKARLVAARYGTEHTELVVRPDAGELLTDVVSSFDEPFADSSALPTYLVSELAARDVKVVLSGEGGDELFGGYYTYVADVIAPIVGPAIAPFAPLIERLPSTSTSLRLEEKLKRFARGGRLPPLERHCSWTESLRAEFRARLLADSDVAGSDPFAVHKRRYSSTEGSEPLVRLQDVDLGVSLVDDQLVKVDRASMAHSLEARVPLLDQAVAEFALALPARHRVRLFSKKRLLRRAAATLVPPEVLAARKQGFSIPAAAWLRRDLQPLAREVLSRDVLTRQGFFRPDAAIRLLEDHVARKADYSRQIWSLLVFTIWFEQVGRDARTAAVSVSA
jgi:asparagine synthase (glutamine-hydrolysing)